MKTVVAIFVVFFACCNAGFGQSLSPMEAAIYRTIPLPVQQGSEWKQWNARQQDIAYLFALIEDAYPYWQQKITVKEKAALRARLLQQFATDTSLLRLDVAVQRVLARLKDAHCSSRMPYLHDAATADGKEFALQLHLRETDFYLRNVSRTADSNLIGSKIMAINGLPMKVVRRIVKDFESVESMEGSLFRFVNNRFNSAFWLQQMGLANNGDSLVLRVELPNKKQATLVLQAQPAKEKKMYQVLRKETETGRNAKGFYYKIYGQQNLAFVQLNTMTDFEAIKDGIGQYVNKETLPMALKFMQDRHQRAGTLNFNKFILEAMDSIRRSGVQNIVLDLRYNGGGDMRIPKQFLYLLQQKSPVKEFATIKKFSSFYQQAVHEDFKTDSILFGKQFGKPLVANGRMIDLDSVCGTPEYKDFYYDVKRPGTPFYIDPATPRFKGNLYVLTSFSTGSAAMITATTVADNKMGLVVGLPTGNQPTNSTGASNCKLPNSGIAFSFSYTYMRRPDVRKNADLYLKPDILIWRNADSLNNGVDEHFEWVVKDIREKATR
jgi:C-terminal processing protease CtpA/Prc